MFRKEQLLLTPDKQALKKEPLDNKPLYSQDYFSLTFAEDKEEVARFRYSQKSGTLILFYSQEIAKKIEEADLAKYLQLAPAGAIHNPATRVFRCKDANKFFEIMALLIKQDAFPEDLLAAQPSLAQAVEKRNESIGQQKHMKIRSKL